MDTSVRHPPRHKPVRSPPGKATASIGPLAVALVLVACSCDLDAQTVSEPLPPGPPPVSGEGYELRLELGIEHSDNRGRFDPRGPSDTLLVPRLDVTVFRTGARLDLRGVGQIEFRHSLPDRFEDELRANVRTELDWKLLPGRVTWNFADVASVESVDVLAVDNPGNLQQTNVFATGPELALGTRGPWRGILRARFAASLAEETDEFDTNRTSMLARAIRSLGPTRRVSVEFEAADLRVRDKLFVDAEHQRGDLLARYSTEGASTRLELVGGHTWTDFDTGRSPVEPLGRVELAWRRGNSLRAHLAASHELSDAARDLLMGLETLDPEQLERPPGIGRRLRVGAEIFILDNFEAGIGYSGSRQQINLTAFYRDYDFGRRNPELDFSGNGLFAAFSRKLSGTTTAGAGFTLERRRFKLESRRDTDLHATLFLERRLNRRLAVRGSLARNQRWSNVFGADSRENVLGVAVIFYGGRS